MIEDGAPTAALTGNPVTVSIKLVNPPVMLAAGGGGGGVKSSE